MNYSIAVRALCEFTGKQGDLDLRFTPSPSAQEGIAGHVTVASRRPKDYETEISLTAEYKNLHVRGRADGYDPKQNRIDEVKTFRGDLSAMPDNHRQLHWAQAKMYGWLLCKTRGLKEINVALVYFDIGSQKESMLIELYSADALKAYFATLCDRFITWADQELAHRTSRDQSLTNLMFPHADFRPGQRYLAESVYKSALSGRCLMAQAPTGIGKTMGTIFPLLKASPNQKIDKIFFLTAKTSGRSLALDSFKLLNQNNAALPLRVLELVARDKSCENPDKECHGDSCSLAKGFYDRIQQARQAAIQSPFLDQQSLRAVALEHQVCPYYLSQEMVRWSDVVIGDYNYYFDTSAMLHGLTVENKWRVTLLIDEAHNMIERARKMYTAELGQKNLRFARKFAPKSVQPMLDRVDRQWNELHKSQQEEYQVYGAVSSKFLYSLQQACIGITDCMTDNLSPLHEDLQSFYFAAHHFSQLAESFGEHSLFDITKGIGASGQRHSKLCLRNIVPAPFLKPRFDSAHSSVLFSATLNPWNYYVNTLGLPEKSVWIDVDAPFDAQQLTVHISHDISTRYQDRNQSLAPIIALITQRYHELPGNYLAFFSSFDYLQKACNLFVERNPDIPVWQQSRGMNETDRVAFLDRFETEGKGIGFAILGGAFGEGIDLPGDRLIGAFIATLGLPQINPINEKIRKRMDELFEQGYDYTYVFPGLQKVVQAAGRVIRTQQDRGVIYLMDDRFAHKRIQALLPHWWKIDSR